MPSTPSSLNLDQLVEQYVDEFDWEQDRAHVQNTSKTIRKLVQELVETGSIDEGAMRTVYNLCQNDDAFSPSRKKARIDDLDIDPDVNTAIKDRIDDGIGIVGKGTYSVPIEGHEDAAFELLSTAIQSEDRSEIDTAIETFGAQDIEGVQNGIISPILYFLHPTKYPISNHRSRTGMQEYFGYEMSGRLTSYLDEVERFSEVRADYPFKEDFRHLDSFFNWIEKQDLDQDPLPENLQNRDFYWVNQNREVELEEEYLRSQDKKWQRDLTVLNQGDVVFHYTNQAIRACSVVTREASQTEMDGGNYYRVDVNTTNLDDPIPLAAIRDTLQDPEYRQDQSRYPLNKNGNVIQAYLCHLTPEAGQYLLAEADIELPQSTPDHTTISASSTNYYWATADPSIWSVDEIADGSSVLYTAYNEKGNKKRLFDAFTTAAPGDRVLFYESTPVKQIVAEGTIVEGLNQQSDRTSESAATDDSQPNNTETRTGIRIEFDRRIDGIKWEDLQAIPDLQAAKPIANRAQGSLFPLTEDEFETILALEDTIEGVSQDAIDQLATKLTSPEVEVSLPEGLYFEDDDRLQREIEASLRSGKHIILTGPPGTGKTKLAKAICASATTYEEVDDYRFTTATSEWTAFDTIGGYVPSTSDGGEELLFEPRLFLKCFRQDRIVNEWLIIDEINRSDIDKAFGQLFSVLSGDSTELPYERDRTVELRSLSASATDEELADIIANPDAFPVTPSWRLIATMNTYDKTSLYEMSYAFMRRFNFVHIGVPPLTSDNGVRTSLLDPNGTDNYATAWLTDDDTLRPILEDVYPIVAVLWQRINEHRVIGPSIVYDIIRYLNSYDDTAGTRTDALTSAIVSLVYPQLEGMRPEQQKRLIRSLTANGVNTEHGEVDLNLDGELLRRKAADFFGITFKDDA